MRPRDSSGNSLVHLVSRLPLPKGRSFLQKTPSKQAMTQCTFLQLPSGTCHYYTHLWPSNNIGIQHTTPTSSTTHQTPTSICIGALSGIAHLPSSTPSTQEQLYTMPSRKSIAAASNVVPPTAIPCNECKIPKPHSSFSANRLEDLRRHIVNCAKMNTRFDPKTTGFVRCTLCLGGSAVEHQCYHCKITYPRTDKYFSKAMLRKKDEALCWKCSQDQQNDRLSDSSGDEGSGDSEASFETNPFQYKDDASTITGLSKMTLSEGTSSAFDNSSGGVILPSTQAGRSAGGSTIYGGPSASSATGSLRNSIPSSSVGPSSTRRVVSSTASNAASAASRDTWNPNRYGNPGRRSPTASISSSSRGSAFAKVHVPYQKVDMEAARQQDTSMAHARAAKVDEVYVEDSGDSDDEPGFAMPRTSNGSSAPATAARHPAAVDSDDDDAPFNG
ncbi:hypothetical protein Q7P37_003647 [Cladosporium fusiforme]